MDKSIKLRNLLILLTHLFKEANMSATTAEAQNLTSPSSTLTATSVFYFLLVPAVLIWYIYWKVSRRHLIELSEKIPGPNGLPLLGNALEFIGSSPGKKFIYYPLILVQYNYCTRIKGLDYRGNCEKKLF